MNKKSRKQAISLMAAVLSVILFIVPTVSGAEQTTWDCPDCGKTGLTSNFCNKCGHPAPWMETTPDTPAPDEEPTPTEAPFMEVTTEPPTESPTPTGTRTSSPMFVVITPTPSPEPREEDQDLIRAECKYPTIVAGSAQEFTVITKPDIQNLMLYSEDGYTLIKTWPAGENSVITAQEQRMWTFSLTIKTAGSRQLILRGEKASGDIGANSVSVSFKVENAGVISAAGKYAAIAKESEQIFTVVTTTDMKHLMIYTEEDKLLKTWDANQFSTVSNSVRTWTVPFRINNTGSRELAFRAGATTEPTDSVRFVPFDVIGTGVMTVEPETVYMSRSSRNTLTVKTTGDADFLALYEENGKTPLAQWSAGGNSTADGNTRIWTISLGFSETGERALVLKAGIGGTPTEAGRTADFVLAEAKIISAKGRFTAITKGTSQEFTVVTSKDVDRLMLYAEDGRKMLTSWTARQSSIIGEDDLRIWTVERKVKDPGSRKLIFKGGINSRSPVTNEIRVPFKVEKTGVIKADRKSATITKGSDQQFTVKTTSDATILVLYEEDRTTVLGTWYADNSNSKVSGSIRTWTVSLAFGTPGEQTLIFRAGVGDTPTTAERDVSFEVK